MYPTLEDQQNGLAKSKREMDPCLQTSEILALTQERLEQDGLLEGLKTQKLIFTSKECFNGSSTALFRAQGGRQIMTKADIS